MIHKYKIFCLIFSGVVLNSTSQASGLPSEFLFVVHQKDPIGHHVLPMPQPKGSPPGKILPPLTCPNDNAMLSTLTAPKTSPLITPCDGNGKKPFLNFSCSLEKPYGIRRLRSCEEVAFQSFGIGIPDKKVSQGKKQEVPNEKVVEEALLQHGLLQTVEWGKYTRYLIDPEVPPLLRVKLACAMFDDGHKFSEPEKTSLKALTEDRLVDLTGRHHLAEIIQ